MLYRSLINNSNSCHYPEKAARLFYIFLPPGFCHLPFLMNYIMYTLLKFQTFTYCSAKLLSQVDGSLLLLKDSMLITSFVLEMTLESPLDCKEIKPVHPKGNQS